MIESSEPSPPRERAFNAPWSTLVVVLAILGLYAVQSWVGADWPWRFGLIPAELWRGQWMGIVTYMGVHGEWMHAGSNAIGALAFGAPLARRLGEDVRGAVLFFSFFLICGVISGALYAAWNADSTIPMIGASGAVFGLIGAATRLMNPWGRLEPLLSRRVLSMTAAWVGVNVMVAVLGFDPATGVRGIAWEAHLIGLAAGLLVIGPWLRLTGRASAPLPPSGPWSGSPGG